MSAYTVEIVLFANSDNKVTLLTSDFNGYCGLFVSSNTNLTSSRLDSIFCELKLKGQNYSFWQGECLIKKNHDQKYQFELAIKTRDGHLLTWQSLPDLLSIVDGGYEHLSTNEVSRLLEDLCDFSEIISGQVFFGSRHQDTFQYPCKVKMEDISTTDAILIEFSLDINVQLINNSPIILTVDLFETTFLLVGFLECADNNLFVFTLTHHIYRDRRKSGRRVLAAPIITEYGEIVEISDFGFRLKQPVNANFENDLSEITIKLPNYSLPLLCKVVYIEKKEGRDQFLGCKISDLKEFRNLWIHFLLNYQYPYLRFRKEEDQVNYKKLLYDSGYTSENMREFEKMTSEEVNAEWRFIDEKCPEKGAVVIGIDKKNFVATIGVSRVGESNWSAQVMAALTEPEFIPHVRSVYSWRTRFILQQKGNHIAFFQRDKPFLDRFFRKFFLQEGDGEEKNLIWEEWKLFTVLVTEKKKTDGVFIEDNRNQFKPALIEHIAQDYSAEESLNLSVGSTKDYHFIKGRPYLHLCQYFTSAWLNEKPTKKTLNEIFQHLGDQNIYTIRTKNDCDIQDLYLPEKYNVIDDGWDVVWICKNNLLSKFLSNSLRSLEIMNRKYGIKKTA